MSWRTSGESDGKGSDMAKYQLTFNVTGCVIGDMDATSEDAARKLLDGKADCWRIVEGSSRL